MERIINSNMKENIKKEELEELYLVTYPTLINGLSLLIDSALSNAKSLITINPNWKDDVRFAVYGKYISELNSTRILLKNANDFIKKENWEDYYNSNFAIDGRNNDFVYMKELNSHIMFASYMGFVSQFESTIKIIARFLISNGNKYEPNYINFIKKKLGIITYNHFLDIVRCIRNSIHNNGIYIPEEDKFDDLPLSFNELSFHFHKNKRVELEWKDCLIIYEELINLTNVIFGNEKISKQLYIRDIVLDATVVTSK